MRIYSLFNIETRRTEGGFTLIELLVILLVLAVLSLVALPAFSRSEGGGRTFQCLNNNRQLCNAWRMYADDNRDKLVYAGDDGTGAANPLNQYAWTMVHMDFAPSNRGNWDINYELSLYAQFPGRPLPPLWSYYKNPSILRCPSDRSSVLVNGVRRPRIRTMSMNLYLGGFLSTDGGWTWADPYRIFTNSTQLLAPGPAKTFVFLDSRPEFVNWGNFMTDMTGFSPPNPSLYRFSSDYPGCAHEGGCGISFADGHVELKRWTDPRTLPNLLYSNIPDVFSSPGNPDVAWLQQHATALK